jgi:hypothetical protein
MSPKIYVAVMVGLVSFYPVSSFAAESVCAIQTQQCQIADSRASLLTNALTVLKHRTSASVSLLSTKITKLSKKAKKAVSASKKLRELRSARTQVRALLAQTEENVQQASSEKLSICETASQCVEPPIAPLPMVEVCMDDNGNDVDCETFHYCDTHPGACFGPPPTPAPPVEEVGPISEIPPSPEPVVFCLDEAGQLAPCVNPAPCEETIRGCVEIIGPPIPVEQVCLDEAGELVPCAPSGGGLYEGGVEEGLLMPVLRRPRPGSQF